MLWKFSVSRYCERPNLSLEEVAGLSLSPIFEPVSHLAWWGSCEHKKWDLRHPSLTGEALHDKQCSRRVGLINWFFIFARIFLRANVGEVKWWRRGNVGGDATAQGRCRQPRQKGLRGAQPISPLTAVQSSWSNPWPLSSDRALNMSSSQKDF